MPALSARDLDRGEDAKWRGLLRDADTPSEGSKKPIAEADEDKSQFLSVQHLRRQYEDYVTNKIDEIEEQKQARRYYHGAQLTWEQLQVLKDRRQPPQIWNRVNRKINRRVGLIQRLRSDPKAFGNNPKSESGAEIATQSIRTVLAACEFKSLDPWCLLQCAIDGISGAQMILVRGDTGDIDVTLDLVIEDEYFYDPKSYRMDFKDRRYEGVSKWFDLDEAIEIFPEHEDTLKALMESGSDLTTNPDREIRWTMSTAKRVRIVEHWYRHRGKWCWAFYVENYLLDQGISPFVDEKGKPASSFYMFSAAVDQDGDRYGFVRNIRDPQDALNAGKSKTLHIANTKLVKATKGTVDDVEVARREIARPDGWVEVNIGADKSLEIVDTKQDLQTFITFTEDAKNELDQDADANLAVLAGSAAIANISGRAIELLRQPGMAELGPFILSYRAWKLRLFRGIWNAVQRHWTKERWLRTSDDAGLAQFIQLNGLGLDQFGRPAIVNAVGALDVNISLEEGPDVAAMMQDTYDALKGYPPGTFPPQVLIELNPNIPRSEKTRLMALMAPKSAPPDPTAELVKRLSIEGLAGKNAKQAAETRRTHAQAEKETAVAQEKMAGMAAEAQATDLAAAEFARDTLIKARELATPTEQPQGEPQRAKPPAIPPASLASVFSPFMPAAG